MSRVKVIPETPVEEEIQSFTHFIGDRVEVVVGKGSWVDVLDDDLEVIGSRFEYDPDQQFERYVIDSDNYAELMSANPAWMLSKPANQFRASDLWPAVDCRRKNTPLVDEVA